MVRSPKRLPFDARRCHADPMFLDIDSSSAWWLWSSVALVLGTGWQFHIARQDLRTDAVQDKRLALTERQVQLLNHLYSSWGSLLRRTALRQELSEGRSRSASELGDVNRAIRDLRRLSPLLRWMPFVILLPPVRRRLDHWQEVANRSDRETEPEKLRKIADEMDSLSAEEEQTFEDVRALIESIRSDDARREKEDRKRRRRVAIGWLLLTVGAGLNVVAAALAVLVPTAV